MAITRATLQRTFRIGCESKFGTCFTIDIEGRRYLVTARHLAQNIESQGDVAVWHDGDWKDVEVKLVGHGQDNLNATVLAPQ